MLDFFFENQLKLIFPFIIFIHLKLFCYVAGWTRNRNDTFIWGQ
jgi:hypothetical protein